ncbi:MAG: NAD(P)-binding domain-containing protein, partial [Candidatus Nanopelagicales bacterium]
MSKTVPTAIVGLGYVGLPLAQAAVNAGVPIVGFDINERTVSELKAGRSPISDIDDDGISAMLAAGFTPTTDSSALDACDTFIICVPTPLSDEQGPDLTAVKAAVRGLVPHINVGDLVVLESTTYPGTTEEVVGPILSESGLSVPGEVKLAFSPERVDPGNATYGITNTPKVVGGVDESS